MKADSQLRKKTDQNKKKVSVLALKNLWIMIDLSGYMLSVQCLKFIMAIGIIIYS